jgi:hypothetical protein
MKASLILLGALDFLLTAALIGRVGIEAEANPVAAGLYARAGLPGMLLLKAATVAVVLAAVRVIRAERPRLAAGLYLMACAATAWAVTTGLYCNAYLLARSC